MCTWIGLLIEGAVENNSHETEQGHESKVERHVNRLSYKLKHRCNTELKRTTDEHRRNKDLTFNFKFIIGGGQQILNNSSHKLILHRTLYIA